MSAAILDAKKRKKTTWAEIAKSTGLSEVYVTSACLGENALSQEESNHLAAFLELSSEVAEALTDCATKA